MILTSIEPQIEGCWITAYKGIAQGETWNELLRNAEEIGANAVLNTCFDNTLEIDTLFHSTAVVVRRQCLRHGRQAGPKRSIVSRRPWSDQ